MADFDISVIVKLVDDLSGRAGRVTEALKAIQERAQQVGETMLNQANVMNAFGDAMIKDSAKYWASFTAPATILLYSAGNAQAAMTELRNTFHGTSEQFQTTAKDIRDFSETLPYAKSEVIGVYTAMSQLNVPVEEQGDLFRIVAEANTAYGDKLGDTAKYLLLLKNTLGLTNEELQIESDKLNYLSSNAGPNATKAVQDLMLKSGSALKALGGSGGVTALQALAGTMAATGVQGEAASTGIRQFLGVVGKSGKPSGELATALANTKVSMQDLQAAMAKDPGRALGNLLARINQLPDAKKLQAMRAFFGAESGAGMAGVVDNLDIYERILAGLNDTSAITKDRQDAVNRSMEDFNTKLGMLWNTMKGLKDGIAGPWLDVMGKAADVAREWLMWLERSPFAMKALSYSLGALALMGPGLSAAGMALKGLSVAWMGLAGAVAAPGVTLALAGLAAVAYVIYNNWDKIAPVWERVSKAGGELVGDMQEMWTALKKVADDFGLLDFNLGGLGFDEMYSQKGVVEAITTVMNALASALERLHRIYEAFKNGGVGAGLSQLWEENKGAGAGITGFLGDSFEIAPDSPLNKVLEWNNKAGGAITDAAKSVIPGLSPQSQSNVTPYDPNYGRLPNPIQSGAAFWDSTQGLRSQGMDLINSLYDKVMDLVGTAPANAAATAPVTGSLPSGITIQAQGPNVQVVQAPPNISVTATVNVQSPDEAPAATANAVGAALASKVRSGMYDGGNEF